MTSTAMRDVLVIGGGINGCGIARDAAGRGLSVTLVEMRDLASAGSSATAKLLHGRLCDLDDLRLLPVREALLERDVLLRAMPHIVRPLRFVMPVGRGAAPAVCPTTGAELPRRRKGGAGSLPKRLALFLYDHLGGRSILPGAVSRALPGTAEGAPLKPGYRTAWEYSDCGVEDSRLVVLNARDAAAHGAEVLVRTRAVSAEVVDGVWHVILEDAAGNRRLCRARSLVNAAGPWVSEVIGGVAGARALTMPEETYRTHIVVPKLYDHDKGYAFAEPDGGLLFAIPFEAEFTLIGRIDAPGKSGAAAGAAQAGGEAAVLAAANRHFATPIRPGDVLRSFTEVSLLHRGSELAFDEAAGAPFLSVLSNRITTYRRLAEHAVDRLARHLGGAAPAWTATAPLPGGDFVVNGVQTLADRLVSEYGFLTPAWGLRLIRSYGTEAWELLGKAATEAELGQAFGATLTAREVGWLMEREFAQRAEDVVWRRTRLGLKMSAAEIAALDAWMTSHVPETRRAAAE